MKYGLLRHTRLDIERIKDIQALCQGGRDLEERITRFIEKTSSDNEITYAKKCRIAPEIYLNYPGTAIGYYSGYIFSFPLNVRQLTSDNQPIQQTGYYADFKNNVDGNRADLDSFFKERFEHALITGRAFWLVQLPELDRTPENLEEWETLGAGRATLRPIETTDICDWETDDAGVLQWLIVRDCQLVRPTPGKPRNRVLERFWVYTRETVQQFSISYEQGDRPDQDQEIPGTAPRAHGFNRVPIIMLEMPKQLWLGENLRPPAIANLRANLRLEWSHNTQAFAVPVIKTKNTDLAACFGQGLAIRLGENDSFEWSIPVADALQHFAKRSKSTKDELYRVANLNFLGAENNSYALVRSGKSRLIDQNVGHITLKSYARLIKEAVERTYETIVEGRRETLKFVAEDFEQLSDLDLPRLVTTVYDIKTLGIPSATLSRELLKEIAAKFGADLSQESKLKIQGEIDQAKDEDVLGPPLGQLKTDQRQDQ